MRGRDFRKLQTLGILKHPSKYRIKTKTSSNLGREPAAYAYDMLRSVVDQQERTIQDREVLLAWDDGVQCWNIV